MAGMGYLCSDWRTLNFICALTFIPYAFLVRFVVKSPRWLTVRGELVEAQMELQKIADGNKCNYVVPTIAPLLCSSNLSKQSWKSLFLNYNLRNRVLILVVNW